MAGKLAALMWNRRLALSTARLACGGLLFLFSGASAQAATNSNVNWQVDVWGVEEGLPQNSVISLARSREGYLWLGTLNGLARFDGIRFTTFNESNTRGLDSSRIVHLFEDREGTLWVGTETAGAAMIRDGECRNLDLGRGSRAGRLMAACEDTGGAVWLYTADGQVGRYRAGQVDVWKAGAQQPSLCRSLAASPDGGLWIGVDWGIYEVGPVNSSATQDLPLRRFLPVGGKMDYLLASREGGFWRLADGRVQRWAAERLERDFGPYPWSTTGVSAACEDQAGNLVVGTLGAGVFWFDASGQVANVSTNEGLSNNYILSLHADREGSLWVGTDGGGLNRVRRSKFEVVPATRAALVQSVCADGQGGLWVAQGGRLVRLAGKEASDSGATNGLAGVYVSAVFVDRGGTVWVGTRNGGLFQNRAGRLDPVGGGSGFRNVMAIHEDRNGTLWAGTAEGLLSWDGHEWRTFTTKQGLSADMVRALADDSAGDLWIGTEGGGLNRLHDGVFTTVHKSDGLPSDSISALLADEAGTVWVGTEGGGLARWRAGKWAVLSTREGLASDSVGYLLEDRQQQLWIGSYAGLMRVALESLNAVADGRTNLVAGRTYGKSDGLPTSECSQGSQPAAACGEDGKLWLPTIAGLVAVDPAKLIANTNPPPVVIESVLIDGLPVETNRLRLAVPENISIPPTREQLEIHYTSLNLFAPKQARFRYRLVGHESSWVDAGDSRVARYPRLPPGDYTFQVAACNEDGVWNDHGAAFSFEVLPPFWRTWWFLTMTAAVLLLSVAGIVHYFSTQKLQRQVAALRQKEALEKERSRIARDLHDQLGANLTQVALLGEFVETDKDQPAEVAAHSRQICQTARDTTRSLDEIVWAANPANDTLDALVNYCCKYSQDFCALAGLRHRLDVPANLPAVTLPPEIRHNLFLAFKEAVNNVVKHAKATEVRVRLRLAEDAFTLAVEDNGRGLGDVDPARAQTRNGLRNMHRRMEDIHGRFSVANADGGGTLVEFTAPWKKTAQT